MLSMYEDIFIMIKIVINFSSRKKVIVVQRIKIKLKKEVQ